jgi:hypothetical protein
MAGSEQGEQQNCGGAMTGKKVPTAEPLAWTDPELKRILYLLKRIVSTRPAFIGIAAWRIAVPVSWPSLATLQPSNSTLLVNLPGSAHLIVWGIST